MAELPRKSNVEEMIWVARWAFDNKLWLEFAEAEETGFVWVQITLSWGRETRKVAIAELREALDTIEAKQEDK